MSTPDNREDGDSNQPEEAAGGMSRRSFFAIVGGAAATAAGLSACRNGGESSPRRHERNRSSEHSNRDDLSDARRRVREDVERTTRPDAAKKDKPDSAPSEGGGMVNEAKELARIKDDLEVINNVGSFIDANRDVLEDGRDAKVFKKATDLLDDATKAAKNIKKNAPNFKFGREALEQPMEQMDIVFSNVTGIDKAALRAARFVDGRAVGELTRRAGGALSRSAGWVSKKMRKLRHGRKLAEGAAELVDSAGSLAEGAGDSLAGTIENVDDLIDSIGKFLIALNQFRRSLRRIYDSEVDGMSTNSLVNVGATFMKSKVASAEDEDGEFDLEEDDSSEQGSGEVDPNYTF